MQRTASIKNYLEDDIYQDQETKLQSNQPSERLFDTQDELQRKTPTNSIGPTDRRGISKEVNKLHNYKQHKSEGTTPMPEQFIVPQPQGVKRRVLAKLGPKVHVTQFNQKAPQLSNYTNLHQVKQQQSNRKRRLKTPDKARSIPHSGINSNFQSPTAPDHVPVPDKPLAVGMMQRPQKQGTQSSQVRSPKAFNDLKSQYKRKPFQQPADIYGPNKTKNEPVKLNSKSIDHRGPKGSASVAHSPPGRINLQGLHNLKRKQKQGANVKKNINKKQINKSLTDGKFNYSAESTTNSSDNDNPEARANKVKKFFNIPENDKNSQFQAKLKEAVLRKKISKLVKEKENAHQTQIQNNQSNKHSEVTSKASSPSRGNIVLDMSKQVPSDWKHLNYTNIPQPREQPSFSANQYGIVHGYAAFTSQGNFRNYNEDRVAIILKIVRPPNRKESEWPNCSFFGVYDGHGGNSCADFLRDNLHKFIVREESFPDDPEKALMNGFAAAEECFVNLAQKTPDYYNQLPYDRSGSCAVVVLIVNNDVYTANLGDSRALLSSERGAKTYELTRDHKPEDDTEKGRILGNGGQVYQAQILNQITNLPQPIGPFRVFPGRLSISRAFGDIEAKIEDLGGMVGNVIAVPEIRHFKATKKDDFIMVGCDGIFDCMKNKEVTECIWKRSKQAQMDGIDNEPDQFMNQIAFGTESVLKAALCNESQDNVTTLVISLERYRTTLTGGAPKSSTKALKRRSTKSNDSKKFLSNRDSQLKHQIKLAPTPESGTPPSEPIDLGRISGKPSSRQMKADKNQPRSASGNSKPMMLGQSIRHSKTKSYTTVTSNRNKNDLGHGRKGMIRPQTGKRRSENNFTKKRRSISEEGSKNKLPPVLSPNKGPTIDTDLKVQEDPSHNKGRQTVQQKNLEMFSNQMIQKSDQHKQAPRKRSESETAGSRKQHTAPSSSKAAAKKKLPSQFIGNLVSQYRMTPENNNKNNNLRKKQQEQLHLYMGSTGTSQERKE